MSKKILKYDFYCEEALNDKISIKKLYESDTVLAFHHTKPSYEFHVVIVPKEHIKDLLALNHVNDSLVLEIINVAKKIVKENIDFENLGAKFITNIGKFQDTPHLHFHIIAGKKIR